MESDNWRKFIANPDALVEGEKKSWLKLEGIIEELLEELRANDRVETNYTRSEITHLKKLLKNRNNVLANYNSLIDVMDKEKNPDFLKAVSEFGFQETNVAYFLIGTSVLLTTMDTETFKALLLFHLKGVDFKVSDFPSTLEKCAPKTWKKLKPYLDNRFRNALAHAGWAMENNQVVLFEDAKLVPFAKLDFGDFLGRVMEQDRLFGCLVNTISTKIDADFFSR